MTVKTFIDRPILAGVISVLIVILGVLGLVQLPIEQFPNIAPPTVRVQASYTGANAETVMKSVIVPLEESLNGVENMMYMTSSGQMAPLDNFVTLTRVYGSESLSRFNLFPSISVFGEQGEGYSSGEAINAIKDVAGKYLPSGFGYEFGGMSREESSTGNTTVIVFSICLAFIYLILCALYESLTVPLAVIAAVPMGLAGSFLFARWWGLENNIYMQIGLIMLIGLLAKTVILLTEYAAARRKEGMGLVASALSAAKARFRPIIMTSATMVFGMLPLMFASGVGANGNISVGVGTVGGLLFGTLALLFMAPVFFVIFQYIHERIMPKKRITAMQR